ncbi:hypothetical protein ACJX0J_034238, partial [Zea mays]
WDSSGPFKPLHVMNPTRLSFIRSTLCRHFRRDPNSSKPLEGLKVIDVGCGGGILSEASEEDFNIQEAVAVSPQGITATSTSAGMTSSPASSASPPSPAQYVAGQDEPITPAHGAGGVADFASPPEGFDENLDADHEEDAPLRFKRMNNLLGSASAPGLARRELKEHLFLTSDAEPS